MADLERLLSSLARGVDWPETPPVALRLEARRKFRPAPILALAALVTAVVAALAVPGARSAILRFLHLGGVTVERVRVAPRAAERPLTQDLGPIVDRRTAEKALGARFRLPAGARGARFYLSGLAASTVLTAPQPVLLTELRSGVGSYMLKKIVGSTTGVEWLQVDGKPALWISGGRHVFLPPSAPARLAGNVLVWERGAITYRLEGRTLSRQLALRLAGEIDGT